MSEENTKYIAEALINLKYELIWVYFVALCLAILGVYIISRLKKSAELKEINNNFKTVLGQQVELTAATEKIRHLLDKESIFYQIRLSAYHDKSIVSITEIYEAIIHIRDAAKDLGFNPSDEESRKFVRAASAFKSVFDAKKIWLPRALSEHIESVAIDMDNRANKFITANIKEKHIERLSEERINALIKDKEDFYEYIHQEVVAVFNELTKRIETVVSA